MQIKVVEDRKVEIITDIRCNQCGETCCMKDGTPYGLINAVVATGYYSAPVLGDGPTYKFDLCEKCLDKMFNTFKIPVTVE